MKNIPHSGRVLALIAGDLISYVFSLILTLAIRYGTLPSRDLLVAHIPSFSILFVFFLLVSFSAGLFDKQSSFVRSGIVSLLIKAQIINIFIGVAFFYIAPTGITPKANLAIYFVVSTIFLFLWRSVMFPVLSSLKPQVALLIGDGEDIKDLHREVNENVRYGFSFKEMIIPSGSLDLDISKIKEATSRTGATVIVANLNSNTIDSITPYLYSLIFSGIQIVNARSLYENIFDRIPLTMVEEKWLMENALGSLGSRRMYDFLKRLMDLLVSFVLGIISLIFYPFVYLAIKLDDKGSIFITQERIGKKGKNIRITKFRSMTANDGGKYEQNGGKTNLKITRVGKILRMTRIDELPQLWSVFVGDQSLIGPRPELPALVNIYEKEIPYYNVRHLIKPGLSGWAQISHKAHPHHAVAVNDTKDKLSYDLYYVKNRSFGLDVRIALQTMRALLSRQGV